jgi:outer membrane protein assembly factor BamB
VLVAGTTLSTVSAQQWPMFRGPNASGVSEASAPPLRWNRESGENIRWTTEIPGLGHSSPIVWGDRIFVTTAVSRGQEGDFQAGATGGRATVGAEGEHAWRLYCLDRTTGRVLWQREAHTGVPRIGRHVRSSHANETPATNGTYVAAFFGSEGLYVYRMNGELQWQHDLGVIDAGYVGLPEYQWETASSPLIYRDRGRDLVIVQADSRAESFVAAFDLASGREVWRSTREENPSWATPVIATVDGRDLLLTSSPNYFRALDPTTGREIWRFRDEADVKVPTPVIGHGLVFFSGGAPAGREFYAIRPGGRGDISRRPEASAGGQVAWVSRGGPYTPTPIVYGNRLYVLSDLGVLSAFDAGTGELLTRRRVPDVGGTYNASPIAANGHLFLAESGGTIHVVRADDELTLVAANETGDTLMATPALTPD